MKTTLPAVDKIQRQWRIVDADGQVLGRLASRIAVMLRGKDKVTFTPHLDVGDFVVVINASKVRVTGHKLTQKMYRWYSGYPGGLKERSLQDMLARRPERVIEQAVKGMLADGPLARDLFRKLKVYPGPQHPHKAQQPIACSPVTSVAGKPA